MTSQPAPDTGDEHAATPQWHSTACILCSINCGVEVKVDDRTITRVRGDKAHPGSEGYTCEKGLRLDHYQNDPQRLTSPMRRRSDGTYEPVDWDTAIAEVAARFQDVIAEHGGDKIMFYGGGGQGNHLGGGYGASTRAALGIRYSSNALAQEKTGEFWVDGQLFGKASCHTTGDYHHAEVAVFWGKNPWQSHGFPQARRVLKAIANDPDRTLIVVDPRRTETADLADLHLRVAPGGDAHLLAAMLKIIVTDGLAATSWLAEHAADYDELRAHLERVDVASSCAKAGVPESLVRQTAEIIGRATGGVSIFEDLGIQMAPHSTLNSYLEKLLVLLTGNFGVPGGMNLHTRFASLAPGGGDRKGSGGERVTPVTGHRLVVGLVPCNIIPDEMLGEHPDRFRALLVESGNPVHSLADSPRWREAMRGLDFSVVIDVAMTETAREADYVLPAASQFEKWECTFFNLEFPDNYFHLRRPVFAPLEGTLPEYEIHSRLCRALGAYDDEVLAPLHAKAAASVTAPDRSAYAAALFEFMVERPELGKLLPIILYETLGPTLTTPDGADARGAAAVWGLSQQAAGFWDASIRRAGIGATDDGTSGRPLGDELFDRIMASPSGITFSSDDYDETMKRVQHHDGRVHLAIPSLLDEFDALADEVSPITRDDDYPFVLAAGERRSSTANTIMRDPGWRKQDQQGVLRISPTDADRLGLVDGDRARITTKRGDGVAFVAVTDTMLDGHVSLPNGFGLGPGGSSDAPGVAPNELTSAEDRDWFAGTPFHKHVRARIERLDVGDRAAAPIPVAGDLTMRRTRFDRAPCPIARTTDVVGDWWTPIVMREAFTGARRFEDFVERLDVPRATLAARLDRLVEEGLLTTRPYQDRPPRHEYRLTEQGIAFYDVLAAMWRWGADWRWPEGESTPLELVDAETGRRVEPVVVDERTGERLDVRRLRVQLRRPVDGSGSGQPVSRR